MLLYLLFLVGIILLSANVAGFFFSIRPTGHHFDRSLLDNLQMSPDESEQEFLKRMLDVLDKTMIKFGNIPSNTRKYNMTIPFSENFILNLLALYDRQFDQYEFISPTKALLRGSGACSQFAIVLVQTLNRNGFNSRILPLGSHVLVLIQPSGTDEYIADPFFNTIIPCNRDQLKKTPEIIREHYKDMSEQYIILLSESFRTSQYPPMSVKEYVGWKSYYFEPISYILKWLMPVLLMMPLILIKIKESLISTRQFSQGGNGGKEGWRQGDINH